MSTNSFRTKSNGLIVAALALSLAVALPAELSAHAASPTLKVTYASNGKTFTVAKGTLVRVTLDASNWQLAKKSHLSAMKASSLMGGAGAECTVMGNTCGSSIWNFTLKTSGKAYLAAERLTAGEAMRCVTDCTFKVTFKVK